MPPRRFRFRLQSILEYKQKREEEEQRELALKREALAAEERRLLSMQHLYDSRQKELADKGNHGPLQVDELKMYHEYQKKLLKEIAEQNIQVQQAQVDVEIQREKLIEASQQKKIYEKLKEKHHETFVAESDEEERKLLDEISTTKFSRDEDKLM